VVPDAADPADELRGSTLPPSHSRLLILADRASLSRATARGIAHLLSNVLQVAAVVELPPLPKTDDGSCGEDQLWGWVGSRLSIATRLLARLGRMDDAAHGPTLLHDLLHEVAEWNSTQPGAAAVTFEVRADPALPPVGLAPGSLLQAILALVSNAREAASERPGGRVVLEALAVGSTAVIRVRDSGSGIDPTIRGQVLTPFFTTKDPTYHLGIGLSAARLLVESAGGTLVVEDVSTGPGACVCLRIPGWEPSPGRGVERRGPG
jgi:signal transduction histidine kinase